MQKIITFTLLWLLIVNIFGLAVLNRFNLNPDTSQWWLNPSEVYQTQGWNMSSIHSRWDSKWYESIAGEGYHLIPNNILSNIVFFPLYPLLMKSLSFFLLGDMVLSGWILSMVFLILGVVFLYKLIKEFHKEIDPFRAIFLMLIFPTAFFFNAVYTESLFLFLSVAAFYYSFKKKYLISAAFGFLSSITRITGIFLIIPLFWEYCKEFGKKGIFKKEFYYLFLIPLGTLGFFTYHFLKFGNFFLFLEVERNWGRAFDFGRDVPAVNFTNPAIVNYSFDVLCVIFAVTMSVIVLKKLRTSYGIYMFTTILVALSTGTMMSIERYILILFPIFIYAASIKNELTKNAWVLISTLLLAIDITLFVNNYWAG
ncbi:hypothetical protein AUK11_02625 [bacterium CG2_30_37_16]|nr:MAG: hypothetical protein AUK11_02625 [bacterium CG2_30_37_16]PIP30964.1 MAG: hypothetical protein COX25_02015 [bacterium (Candidatus Howlettbacteria) CG23_combo_of_CG06-09_8_20_14_all_37_9]PJB05274.1 MAG: hypothetical protein CO123_04445 [bacterium (Candidatus Howlettbacteria) CG_4_9_14_3_um_filter_37_10]